MEKVKKEKAIVYRIYTYLKNNAVGYDNRIKSAELMNLFEINDNKTFRYYIERIRLNDTLQKIVCSKAGNDGGYWVATTEDEVFKTMEDFYNRSMKMLKVYSKLKQKCNLNNQYRLKLSKYEKDIYESIAR